MKRFECEVWETIYRRCFITVDAPDQENAVQIALERSRDVKEWLYEEQGDRDVEHCEEISDGDDL